MEVNVAMLLLCRYVDYVGYCKERPLTTQTTPPQVVVYLFHNLLGPPLSFPTVSEPSLDGGLRGLCPLSPLEFGGSEKGTERDLFMYFCYFLLVECE